MSPSLSPSPIPLWQQLQGAAAVLLAVRSGRSMTAALESADSSLRPGVQALAFYTLRHLGRAEALRMRLAQRPPPPETDALLCVALGLLLPAATAGTSSLPPAGVEGQPGSAAEHSVAVPVYTPYTLVDQAVEAAKRSEPTRHQASFINGCLRRFLREPAPLLALTDKNPQAVWNHPQWWIDRLRADHPAHWQAILQASNQQPSLILRVNRRKTTPADYLRALAASGIDASSLGGEAVVLPAARAVPSLPGFADGHFSVQDSAAQLAAPLLLGDLLPATDGQRLRVLDACAAPGGKTAHLLELADCDLTALDIDAFRCRRIEENLTRLGLTAHVIVGDAGDPGGWWDGRPFDAILLDAPCTASGIVRRHPDVRWLRRPTDLPQLAAVQARLLNALWSLLRPGGKLLYCTCSVFRAEGEQQAQTFLAHHTNALLRPSPGHLLPRGRLQTAGLPDNLVGEHDGFYYAVFAKTTD